MCEPGSWWTRGLFPFEGISNSGEAKGWVCWICLAGGKEVKKWRRLASFRDGGTGANMKEQARI